VEEQDVLRPSWLDDVVYRAVYARDRGHGGQKLGWRVTHNCFVGLDFDLM
jgi:hypothetical protein